MNVIWIAQVQSLNKQLLHQRRHQHKPVQAVAADTLLPSRAVDLTQLCLVHQQANEHQPTVRHNTDLLHLIKGSQLRVEREDGIYSRRKNPHLFTGPQPHVNQSQSMLSVRLGTGTGKYTAKRCTVSMVNYPVIYNLPRGRESPSSLGQPLRMIGGKVLLMAKQEFSQLIMWHYKIYCIVYFNLNM